MKNEMINVLTIMDSINANIDCIGYIDNAMELHAVCEPCKKGKDTKAFDIKATIHDDFGLLSEKYIKLAKKPKDILGIIKKLKSEIVFCTNGECMDENETKRFKMFDVFDELEYDIMKKDDFNFEPTKKDTLNFTGMELANISNKVTLMCASDDSVPAIQHVRFNDKYIDSLNGYELVRVKHANWNYMGNDILIMGNLLDKLKKCLKLADSVQIYTVGDDTKFTMINMIGENWEIKIRLEHFDGTYINVENIMPSENQFTSKATFNVGELLDSIKYISASEHLKGKDAKPCLLEFNKNDVWAKVHDMNGTESQFHARYYNTNSDNVYKIAMNHKYLENALKCYDKKDDVELNIVNTISPMVIDYNDVYTLMLPVRIAKTMEV